MLQDTGQAKSQPYREDDHMFAKNLTPPYYAVIFTSRIADPEGHDVIAARMVDLAKEQPGFLGVESARGPDGLGITVSYWETEAAITAWKANAAHERAQATGIDRFYEHYELRVARVDRAYSGPEGRSVG